MGRKYANYVSMIKFMKQCYFALEKLEEPNPQQLISSVGLIDFCNLKQPNILISDQQCPTKRPMT